MYYNKLLNKDRQASKQESEWINNNNNSWGNLTRCLACFLISISFWVDRRLKNLWSEKFLF